MRIAMLTNNYKPFIGGVPISIERLSNGLRELGHEVYIFAPTYEGQIEEEGVIRYRSHKKKLNNEIVIPYALDGEIEKKFRKLQIDIIHVHHPNFVGWAAIGLGKKYNVPIVYTYHTRYEQYVHHLKLFAKLEELSEKGAGYLPKKVIRRGIESVKEKIVPAAVRHYANKCEQIFAPTSLMKDVLEDMGVTSPIKVLPTGINKIFFEEDKIKTDKIRMQYIGDKKYLFCTVSRLAKEKNIIFLVEGLSKLKKCIGNQFKMLIIGEGSLKEELALRVKELNLEENIIFLNSVPNNQIKDYYYACDLFLFSSKSETQGIVLLEAMATKTPVVAIKASGVVEVVKNGVNGYMTEDNIGMWVDQIVQVINNEEELKRLQDGAYVTASEYTSEKVAELAARHYRQAIHSYYCKEIECEEIYNYEKMYTR